MAVPSARNSGFDKTWKLTPGLLLAYRMLAMTSAALTGTVDFSTTILFHFYLQVLEEEKLHQLCYNAKTEAKQSVFVKSKIVSRHLLFLP